MEAGARSVNARRAMPDIAIAGGGMIGAACALALARNGFKVVLVEAREPAQWRAEDPEDLRVIALAPSSAKVLDQLGVWKPVSARRVAPYARMHVWDAESAGELHFDAVSEGRAELGWIVENKLLQWTLWQALDQTGVRRVCPGEVRDFEVRTDRVSLELSEGEPLSARMLVIADGAKSTLRDKAGIQTRGRDYAQRAVVAHVATEKPHEAAAWQRFLPGGPIALLPLRDGRSSIVWSMPEPEAQRMLALDDAAFCGAVGFATDYRLGRITETTPRTSFPLRLQLAHTYTSERCVLLGDAAHAVHPLAGQGANLGLRDVTELVAVLSEARDGGRDFAARHVLQRYARRRRSADTLDAWSFDALARAFAWRASPLVVLRGFGMRAVDALTPLKRKLVEHAAGRG
ncbi:MAG TPA: UbiH/UbiF/VisC/COQ6 family ubiquinone biosynthesis hydroxylase [Rhodanobacteraceae bacterium]|nr:UbiH/UbiF/VisC/COQ6 family ubiquinone biosynthesis hydroxylase [Rhodanobacteraceae bacterium]